MNINEAIKVLKKHNKWRLGDKRIKATEPKELTAALNSVINFTENHKDLVKLHSNRDRFNPCLSAC